MKHSFCPIVGSGELPPAAGLSLDCNYLQTVFSKHIDKLDDSHYYIFKQVNSN